MSKTGAHSLPLHLVETGKSAVTQQRILDVAESLFMEHGFEATGLRQITAAAAVNLAAVHYHFGSKEELFQAVLKRRLDPMNQERVELLDALERESQTPPACEAIIAAMFIPALKLARDKARGGNNFLRLLGRAYADPAPFIRHFLSREYAPMIVRFKAAIGRALPHLPPRELSWRLHFLMGAMSYTLAGTDVLKLISELHPVAEASAQLSDELLLRRLGPFLVAGLQAPLVEIEALSTPQRAPAKKARPTEHRSEATGARPSRRARP